jgi:hypothetical protein
LRRSALPAPRFAAPASTGPSMDTTIPHNSPSAATTPNPPVLHSQALRPAPSTVTLPPEGFVSAIVSAFPGVRGKISGELFAETFFKSDTIVTGDLVIIDGETAAGLRESRPKPHHRRLPHFACNCYK